MLHGLSLRMLWQVFVNVKYELVSPGTREISFHVLAPTVSVAAVVEQAGFPTCCCHKGQSEGSIIILASMLRDIVGETSAAGVGAKELISGQFRRYQPWTQWVLRKRSVGIVGH